MGAPGTTKPVKTAKIATAGTKSPAARRSALRADKSVAKSDREQPYHHGDLHGALLTAAKRVAEREGLQGLTLRAVAREAGVSHAAPAHHFGDVTGLISELAAVGFKKFSAELAAAAGAATSPDGAAEGRAQAYVAFARDNPCLFQLMFRAERLDHTRPALRQAAENAFVALAKTVGARRHEEVSPQHLTLAQAADIARIWSMVHGFAMLYLDGRLRDILDGLPPGTTEEMLLAAMLTPEVKTG
ncbi:MAG TPA: WHG domain-containing protein [Tardiphaga sp.]